MQDPRSLFTPQLDLLDQAWTKHRLSSGLEVLHVPSKHVDSFYIGAIIRAGTRMETPENVGVAHFLEHMMFRGSRQYPNFAALAAAFEDLGGEWNAETSHEHTEYWFSGIRHHAARALDLFADFLFFPELLDLEIERKVIVREIEGDLNEFGHSTDADFHTASMLWPDSSLAFPITGTIDSVNAMTLQQIADYRKEHYRAGNMLLWTVGHEWNDLLPYLEKSFSPDVIAAESSPPNRYPAFSTATQASTKWVEENDNEYNVQLSFLCEGEWSPKIYAYELLVRLLSDGFSSRLHSHMREKLGLVYEIDAISRHYDETGSIDITAPVLAENLDVFLSELFGILRRVKTDGPAPDEWQRIRTRSIVDIEMTPQHPAAFASALGWASLCDKDYSLRKTRERLLDVTVEEFMQVASEVLQSENAALVAIGPAADDLDDRLRQALTTGL